MASRFVFDQSMVSWHFLFPYIRLSTPLHKHCQDDARRSSLMLALKIVVLVLATVVVDVGAWSKVVVCEAAARIGEALALRASGRVHVVGPTAATATAAAS